MAEYLKENYKSIRLVGKENLETLEPKTIYVSAAFLDMGKNNFIVKAKNRFYFQETMANFRREIIPPTNIAKENAVVKVRSANVFKLWQKDTADILAKAYDFDFGYSKLEGLIKNKGTQEDVRDVFLKNYDFLKDVFLTLSIHCGSFPFIGCQDFTRFAKQVKLKDNILTQSRLDYIISNVKSKHKNDDKEKERKIVG